MQVAVPNAVCGRTASSSEAIAGASAGYHAHVSMLLLWYRNHVHLFSHAYDAL